MTDIAKSNQPTGEQRPPVTFEENMAALDQLGAAIDARLAEIESLKNQVCGHLSTIKRYRDAMENVCDELEEDFDTVDGGDGQPAPNKAMRLASELKEAIYGPGGY